MVPLKLQKIILFIPYINAFILLIYVYNTVRAKWSRKKFLMGVLLSFMIMLPIIVLNRLMVFVPLGEFLRALWNFVYIYAIGIAIGVVLIRQQKKMGLQ